MSDFERTGAYWRRSCRSWAVRSVLRAEAPARPRKIRWADRTTLSSPARVIGPGRRCRWSRNMPLNSACPPPGAQLVLDLAQRTAYMISLQRIASRYTPATVRTSGSVGLWQSRFHSTMSRAGTALARRFYRRVRRWKESCLDRKARLESAFLWAHGVPAAVSPQTWPRFPAEDVGRKRPMLDPRATALIDLPR